MRESAVLRECLYAFSHYGFDIIESGMIRAGGKNGVVWRNNTGAARIGKRFIRFGVAGMPDITGVMTGGRFVACEVKTTIGRVTAHQSEMIARLMQSGALAFVARSYADCENALKAAGVTR